MLADLNLVKSEIREAMHWIIFVFHEKTPFLDLKYLLFSFTDSLGDDIQAQQMGIVAACWLMFRIVLCPDEKLGCHRYYLLKSARPFYQQP